MRAILYLGFVLVAVSSVGAQTGPARPPIIDVHLHTYNAAIAAHHPSNPATGQPGPASPAEHMRATLAAMEQYNIVAAIVSGSLEAVDAWHRAAPPRILGSPLCGKPGVDMFGEALPTLESPRGRYRERQLKAMAEVTAQYEGLSPSDTALDPYFALAEELDVPVGIHTGTSFPGTPFSGTPRFRVEHGLGAGIQWRRRVDAPDVLPTHAWASTVRASDTSSRSAMGVASGRGLEFDGDLVTDVSVYRPSTGDWWLLTSRSGFQSGTSVRFGIAGDQPVAGDFDGDGKRDPAVYRPQYGTWLWLKSSTANTTYEARGWGIQAQGDTPVPGDYDGDGKTDPTVYRPGTGTWFVLKSKEAYTQYLAVGWGLAGDVPVPGDYDGDGRTDMTVYRPAYGTWFVLQSKQNYTQYWALGWGEPGDVPLGGRQ